MMRTAVFVAAGVLLGLGLATALAVAADSSEEPSVITYVHPNLGPAPEVKVIRIDPRDDRGKAGSVRGVMGHRSFEFPPNEPATRPAYGLVRFVFTAPVEIVALDLSVDINDPRLQLVEFGVGLNAKNGWGWDGNYFDRRADWLLMASWSDTLPSAGSIDKNIVLPEGVQLAADEDVTLAGWIGGSGEGSALRVYPELLVLYRWL